ncbi:NAD-glutamate dehydrogenase [Steroidobacter agaridevorans]|uniref:NAD-glutamate dehydrogenase n=1 Tax=Steroidobacter agaridevorans TaxID=2695856 RepID=UPI00132C7533|nr:NAD-glutamate dehydrogenase [Steroidobacter agaridevorans]GFE88543.1 NAD-glutamate dehydrogenase [Steroidobacter agaridevorans]
MTTTIPAARQKLIERIAQSARALKRRGDPLDVQEFVRQYYRGVGEEDLAEYRPDTLAALALAHLRSASVRKPSRPLVRVFNTDEARDGWSTTHTIVEVTTEDMPFLVDSLGMVLTQAGLTIHMMVHPVLPIRRDRAGKLEELGEVGNGKKFTHESWQHIEIDRIGAPERLQEIEQKLLRTLEDVRLAVGDWSEMRQRASELANEIERDNPGVQPSEAREAKALLDWMAANHFTFLGYRQYELKRGRSEDLLVPMPETGLGILRARKGYRAEPTVLTGELREHARQPELMQITKANSVSTVHRATYLDYVGVKTVDSQGRVTGEKRFLGLFTSAVYNRSPREIPMLRHKIERVVGHFGLDPASHDGKAVVHVLETYPRDELFQASITDLIRNVRGIVNLYERQRVRVFLRRDTFGRFYSALIFVPRDRYNTQVREKMEAVINEKLKATAIESQVQISQSALARVHMIIRLPADGGPRMDAEELEQLIAETVLTWNDKLRDASIDKHGELDGRLIAEKYRDAFPAAYQEDTTAEVALDDIGQLNEVVADTDKIAMRLASGEGKTVHLRLFRAAAPIVLSQALPILENMGFVIVSERPYRIAVSSGRPIWLQDFEMQRRDGGTINPATLGQRFTDTFSAVWTGRAENDGFNQLIVVTDLTWRQSSVLRAYCRYAIQTGASFSQAYMEQVLTSNAKIATTLSQLFEAQFDPAVKPARRSGEVDRLKQELSDLLDSVRSLDEDRILRRFAHAIQATLRTNYFQMDTNGAPKQWVSFKLDSRSIPEVPQPRPAFEIFVYSPRVEGVHLRMGQVARGGIRWSDRREDFRTEVLGLMKAQNVKNTLIVPVGAKGGFVPKRMPAGASREDVQREGVECYRTFISALLDITDNIVEGKILPPAQVVRRDGDDPYLVVAADKGTATFSDIANRLAADYNFWLGDAFASGGSAGYDHKKMGITARGGWECVKRHFREMGIDTQSQDFTAIGIGDMAGDVFGNGMLQSPHTRLLAAFNHQHIFLDPEPDAASSYKERQRLFNLPRSTWEDYNRKLISKGGGVYARNVKSIKVSPQVQAMLGIKRDTFTPIELIRAILCMPVDLLWNGGIGTYVKATDESHIEVGDRANDALRVNGRDLRCKVVGEGGNLGMSQRGRVEYALAGGRLNTDFVDNSGGVDCSDHEVNIKILLNNLPKRAGLTLEKRNELLVDMTDEVAALVLRDNYLQSQALSMLEARASKDLLEHAHSIRRLEVSGLLDRGLEFLPASEEITERHQAGKGLTRPELAILLAYAKMALYSKLIDSDVPEDSYLGHELERYFPALMQKRFNKYLPEHRLRREIIATATTNSIVNRMGPTFARRVQEDTGANAGTVARAYAIAREFVAMRDTWADIEALDTKIAAAVQYEMMFETTRLLRFCTYWLIHRLSGQLDIERQVSRFRKGMKDLDGLLPKALSGDDLSVYNSRHSRYVGANVPDKLARRMASLMALRSGPDLIEISEASDLSLDRVAALYFGVGTALSLDWIREQVEVLGVEGHWQAVARTTLRDNVYNLQRALCLQVIGESKRSIKDGKASPAELLEGWSNRHRAAVDYLRQTVSDMRALPAMDFATLSVALQAVRRMTE